MVFAAVCQWYAVLQARMGRRLRSCRVGLALLVLVGSATLGAEPVVLTDLPAGSLGRQASVLFEQEVPLQLAQAQALQAAGAFHAGERAVLTLGIGAPAVWVHVPLSNPTGQPLPLRLTLGTTWLDHLDVYLVHGGIASAQWQTGDSYAHAPGLVPASGFVFTATVPAGRSDLYLRVQTDDPLVLPIRLQADAVAAHGEVLLRYGYGFLYGFLMALAIYNGVLYTGLRERSYLYYAVLLLCFIMTNLGYSGHGAAWLWPDWPGFQRYIVLVLMVLYGCCGLLFASRFLALAEHAPRVLRMVQGLVLVVLALLILCLLWESQHAAALLAFNFLTLFSVLMVTLGIITIRHNRVIGRYFLAASCFGMLGMVLTTLATWGWLPFHAVTYHAAEVGVLIEATLLALALAAQVRQHEVARQSAEQLAREDALTGLHNRRAFWELAEPIWFTAQRNSRALSLVMLDIDFFKQINDRYGHEVGDRVLVDVAQVLTESCRAGDLLVRWGGEEFLLFLPETDLANALRLVERMRRLIAARRLQVNHQQVTFTASFGVAALDVHATLRDLIGEADERLYEAKATGRNRVVATAALPAAGR